MGDLDATQLSHSTGHMDETAPDVQLPVENCEQAVGSVNPLQFGIGGHPLRMLYEWWLVTIVRMGSAGRTPTHVYIDDAAGCDVADREA